jgi:hypothetical protein
MKVQVTASHVLEPGRIANEGDILELPTKVAEGKIRRGYARPYIEPAQPGSKTPPATPPGQITIGDPSGDHRDPEPTKGGKGKPGLAPGGGSS